jgi:hypothetical protein
LNERLIGSKENQRSERKQYKKNQEAPERMPKYPSDCQRESGERKEARQRAQDARNSNERQLLLLAVDAFLRLDARQLDAPLNPLFEVLEERLAVLRNAVEATAARRERVRPSGFPRISSPPKLRTMPFVTGSPQGGGCSLVRRRGRGRTPWPDRRRG